MKKILLAAGILSLLLVGGISAATTEEQPACGEDSYFDGSYTCTEYGQYCVEYGETCVNYAEPTYQCPLGYSVNGQYESPNWCDSHSCPGNDDKWEKPCYKDTTTIDCGWQWVGVWPHKHLDWVCEENTITSYANLVEVPGECVEYNCVGYESYCSESGWVGSCVPNQPEGGGKGKGGASFIQFLPKVSSQAKVEGREVSFLSTHYGIGGILLNDQPVPFPIDIYGQPLESFFDVEFEITATEPADFTYGYEWGFVEDSPSIYHTIEIPADFPAGDYYVRLYFTGYNYGFGNMSLEGQYPSYGPVLSQEQLITIE